MAGPRDGQPVLQAGEPLERASAAMVLVHGRGASAQDIMLIASELPGRGFAYLAPQAAGGTWYPYPFTAPLERNEPWLSSALDVIAGLMARIEESIPADRVILLGFSQGACLALEFAARHARRYGGVAGLSGALIGPDGMAREYAGSLAGTPVLVASSDVDPYVPAPRVEEAGEVLRRLGGEVTVRLYPGLGHEVNRDEIQLVGDMMTALVPPDQLPGTAVR